MVLQKKDVGMFHFLGQDFPLETGALKPPLGLRRLDYCDYFAGINPQ